MLAGMVTTAMPDCAPVLGSTPAMTGIVPAMPEMELLTVTVPVGGAMDTGKIAVLVAAAD